MNYNSFEQWMNGVNQLIRQVTGSFISDDLSDFDYAKAFEDGVSPQEIAAEVLEQNGFDATILRGNF